MGIAQSKFFPLTEPWTIVLNGKAQNCGDTTAFTKSFQPFTPNQEGDKIYSDPNSPVLDDDLNSYLMTGRELGSSLYFTLGDYAQTDYRNALFYGIITATIRAGHEHPIGQHNHNSGGYHCTSRKYGLSVAGLGGSIQRLARV